MPPVTPLSGFSIIIHLGINLVTWVHGVFSGKARVDFSTVEIKPRPADTIMKRLASYATVSLILVFISGQGTIILIKGLKSHSTYTVVRGIFVDPVVEAEEVSSSVEEIDTLTPFSGWAKMASQTMGSNQLPISEAAAVRAIPKKYAAQRTNSLIDFLHANGGDSTFTARATLAKRLGIVNETAKYSGSARQNSLIITALIGSPK